MLADVLKKIKSRCPSRISSVTRGLVEDDDDDDGEPTSPLG
jgi:hypothetical protein